VTVAVTGASGFLGRHLIARLTAAGRDVVALTREARRLEPGPRLRVVQTDYRSIDFPQGATVVHLAAARNLPGGNPLRINVPLARAVAGAARERRVSCFVLVATALALGSSSIPLDETAPLAVSADPYIRSRIESVRELESMEGLPLVTLFPSIIYGPDFPDARNRVTSHMRRLLTRPLRLAVGGATAPRNLVYVDDVIAAIERAEGERPGTRRVVAGEDVVQDEFERLVCSAAGRRAPRRVVLPRAVAAVGARAADALMRRGEQGWTHRLETLLAPWCFRSSGPFTALVDGVARTVGTL
jgi:UDP-glucose 4-epimerase